VRTDQLDFGLSGQTTNPVSSGFQYDTNGNGLAAALGNATRYSPPRTSATYEVPGGRTFHSTSNSVCTNATSPRDSIENQLLSGNQETAAPLNELSPQYLTASVTMPVNTKETYSIL
jgi:hypothetical protein